MVIERTVEGWEAVFRARGMGRYFIGAFLGFWLCGWAAGEVAVLGILGYGVWALANGMPLFAQATAEAEPASTPLVAVFAVGGFLLVWLGIWTFGGTKAIFQFLRLVVGEDRVVVGRDSLRMIEKAGPFRRTREVPRRDIVRLFFKGRSQPALMVATASTSYAVVSLAEGSELEELRDLLAQELEIPEEERPALPREEEEEEEVATE